MKPLYERPYYSFMMQESESNFYLLVQEIAIKYIINTFPSNFLVKKKGATKHFFAFYIFVPTVPLQSLFFFSLWTVLRNRL